MNLQEHPYVSFFWVVVVKIGHTATDSVLVHVTSLRTIFRVQIFMSRFYQSIDVNEIFLLFEPPFFLLLLLCELIWDARAVYSRVGLHLNWIAFENRQIGHNWLGMKTRALLLCHMHQYYGHPVAVVPHVRHDEIRAESARDTRTMTCASCDYILRPHCSPHRCSVFTQAVARRNTRSRFVFFFFVFRRCSWSRCVMTGFWSFFGFSWAWIEVAYEVCVPSSSRNGVALECTAWKVE